MAKKDYKDTNLKNEYKTLVKDPESDLAKITVSSDEKRTRAELLDILEELFENNELMFNPTFQLRLKAMLHILIKSIDNTLDDNLSATIATNTAKTGISNSQASAITANTSKTGITTTQVNEIKTNTAKTGISTPFTGATIYPDGDNSTATFRHDTKASTLVVTVTIPEGPLGRKQPAVTKSATLTLS